MSQSDAERWQRLYSRLLDIERHWTEQVQNQQQRISTILTVNGFLLGFLAIAGFSESIVRTGPWSAGIFLVSLAVLAAAFGTGILSLRPGIPISGAGLAAPSVRTLLNVFGSTKKQRADALRPGSIPPKPCDLPSGFQKRRRFVRCACP